ncbi:hypothetical protein APHAL10511_008631 [Amanita phalloides]|nr:hypothetical protein APHAL10511_008631 [Amanita phalloides]
MPPKLTLKLMPIPSPSHTIAMGASNKIVHPGAVDLDPNELERRTREETCQKTNPNILAQEEEQHTLALQNAACIEDALQQEDHAFELCIDHLMSTGATKRKLIHHESIMFIDDNNVTDEPLRCYKQNLHDDDASQSTGNEDMTNPNDSDNSRDSDNSSLDSDNLSKASKEGRKNNAKKLTKKAKKLAKKAKKAQRKAAK